MKNVSFHIFLLLVQTYLASEVESRSVSRKGSHHIGHLIKTKSGKVFVRRSSKKELSSKKDKEEVGQDYSNDDEIQVAGNKFFSLNFSLLSLSKFVNVAIFVDFCPEKKSQAMFFLKVFSK